MNLKSKVLITQFSVLGLLIISSTLVLAVEPFRSRTPIISGTEIQFPTANCTAGLVLKRTGFSSNWTAYLRSVRYVLTAGHCGNLNDTVKVANQEVGKVVWKSNTSDLALVLVPPLTRHYRTCSAPSTGLTCSIGTSYEPLALGKVFVSALGNSFAISGTGIPGTNEIFCTSGKSTGINCTWHAVSNPPLPGWMQPAHPQVDKSAETHGRNVLGGDSGGPVIGFNSAHKIYGIITDQGDPRGPYPNYMKYTPISHFFNEQPNYEIAPAQ